MFRFPEQHVGIETIWLRTVAIAVLIYREHSKATCFRNIVHWPEEYPVPYGRSAEAGKLSRQRRAVADVDAIGLVNIVRNLNCGLISQKNSIGGNQRSFYDRLQRIQVCLTSSRRCASFAYKAGQAANLRSRSRLRSA